MRICFKRGLLFSCCAFSFIYFAGCKPAEDKNLVRKSEDQIALYKKGRAVYQAACIACHNANPKMDGALGPVVAGSSKELLEARIIRAEYPKGYQPKRTTKLMVAMPQNAQDVPALYEFLRVE